MKRKALLLTIAAMVAMHGCIVVKDKNEEWKDVEISKGNVSGPGADEISYIHWERNLYDIDSSKRIGIGLFPSFFDKHFELKDVPDYNQNIDYTERVIACAIIWPLSNCLNLGFPTIGSLFVAPFSENVRTNNFVGMGMVGCYQWESGDVNHELIDAGESEDIVRFTQKEDVWRDAKCGRTADGTKLYFGYPGAQTIIEDVNRDGKVAVMYDYPTTTYRLFSKAKLVDDAFNIIDMVGRENNMECRQSAFVHKCDSVRNKIRELGNCEGLQASARETEGKINVLLTKLPEIDEEALSQCEIEFKEKAVEIAKRQVAEGNWKSALDICDKLAFQGADEVKKSAQDERERHRIAMKLWNVDAQMKAGDWDEAIKLAEGEENQEIKEKLEQVKQQITEAILVEIKSSEDEDWLTCISEGRDPASRKQIKRERRRQAQAQSLEGLPKITMDEYGMFSISGTRNQKEYAKAIDIACKICERDRDKWNETARRMTIEVFGNGEVCEEENVEVEVCTESNKDKMIRLANMLASAEIKAAAETRLWVLDIQTSDDLEMLKEMLKRKAKQDEREDVREAAEKRYCFVMEDKISSSTDLEWLEGVSKANEYEEVKAMAAKRIIAVWKGRIRSSDDLDWISGEAKNNAYEEVRIAAQHRIVQLKGESILAVDRYYDNLAQEDYSIALNAIKCGADSCRKAMVRFGSEERYPWRKVAGPRYNLSEAENNLGRSKIEEFAGQYMPNAFAEYEKAYEKVEELQQMFNEEFANPFAIAQSDRTWDVCAKLFKGLIKARTQYFRCHDDLCHFYLLYKASVLSGEELGRIDGEKLSVFPYEENVGYIDFTKTGASVKQIVALGEKERTFAEKYAPETYAVYQKCEGERAEAQKLLGELLADARIMDVTRFELPIIACREKIDVITLTLNRITDDLKVWRVEHKTMEKDAETIAKLDHANALKWNGFVELLPGYVKDRSVGPTIPSANPMKKFYPCGRAYQWHRYAAGEATSGSADYDAEVWQLGDKATSRLKAIDMSRWFRR